MGLRDITRYGSIECDVCGDVTRAREGPQGQSALPLGWLQIRIREHDLYVCPSCTKKPRDALTALISSIDNGLRIVRDQLRKLLRG